MNAVKLLALRLLSKGGASDDSGDELNTPVAFKVTTTAVGTALYITQLFPAVDTTVYWGDGSQTTYSAFNLGGASHIYASTGEWTVRISSPESMLNFELRGGVNRLVNINSADLVDWRPANFYLTGLTGGSGTFNSADLVDWRPQGFYLDVLHSPFGGTFNSADLVDWRPTTFFINDLPPTFSGVFDSADLAGWTPGSFKLRTLPSTFSGTLDSADLAGWGGGFYEFELNNLPSTFGGTLDSADFTGWSLGHFVLNLPSTGFTGTFDSADLTGWTPEVFEVVSLPSGFSGAIDFADFASWQPLYFTLTSLPATVSTALTAADFSGWTGLYELNLQDNSFTQAEVDVVLLGLYAAALSRTESGGYTDLSGSNAVPSGTFAMECPPVTGLGAKHALLNDGCSTISGMVWDEVTTTE